MSPLLALLELYPSLRSNPYVVLNPNVEWEDIQRLKIDLGLISESPNLNDKIVLDNPEIGWDWDALCSNPSISWKLLSCNLDKISTHGFRWMSRRSDITWDIVKAYPDLPWRYDVLAWNKNITYEILQANPDLFCSYYYSFRNPNFTWEKYLQQENRGWTLDYISLNPNITWEIIRDNPQIPWDWYELSVREDLTWEVIISFPEDKWIWSDISRHNNITLDIIIANLGWPWKWEFVAMNPNIRFEDIKAHPELPWNLDKNWKYWLGNPNLTLEIILSRGSLSFIEEGMIIRNLFNKHPVVKRRLGSV